MFIRVVVWLSMIFMQLVLIVEVLIPLLANRRLFPVIRSIFGWSSAAEEAVEDVRDALKDINTLRSLPNPTPSSERKS